MMRCYQKVGRQKKTNNQPVYIDVFYIDAILTEFQVKRFCFVPLVENYCVSIIIREHSGMFIQIQIKREK